MNSIGTETFQVEREQPVPYLLIEREVIGDPSTEPFDKVVYMHLCYYMPDDDWSPIPDSDELAKMVGCKPGDIDKAIDRLVMAGHISVRPRAAS